MSVKEDFPILIPTNYQSDYIPNHEDFDHYREQYSLVNNITSDQLQNYCSSRSDAILKIFAIRSGHVLFKGMLKMHFFDTTWIWYSIVTYLPLDHDLFKGDIQIKYLHESSSPRHTVFKFYKLEREPVYSSIFEPF